MNALADAVVYAVTYINCRDNEAEESTDDDVGALESIAGLFAGATEDERDELAVAPREDVLNVYSAWMECMFGDGWAGNERV